MFDVRKIVVEDGSTYLCFPTSIEAEEYCECLGIDIPTLRCCDGYENAIAIER